MQCIKWNISTLHFQTIGLYSRGKSHVLRMSVPLQILLSVISTMESEPDRETILEEPHQENPMNVVEPSANEELPDTASDITTDDDNNHVESFDSPILEVGPQAITVAHSIVKTCLSQLCK